MGPTAEERADGVGTEIPADTEWMNLLVDDGVATVDLNEAFVSEETPAAAIARLAQVVYTLTSTTRSAGRVPGRREAAPNFGGYELDGAQRREDFEGQLPWIFVESPVGGGRVSSPVTISGTADVFEAVVSSRSWTRPARRSRPRSRWRPAARVPRHLLDGRAVPGRVDAPGNDPVYEVSAMDGSEINVVDIPVTLTACARGSRARARARAHESPATIDEPPALGMFPARIAGVGSSRRRR